MFPGITTQKQLSHGAHVLSEGVSMLGILTKVVVHRSSQTERQFHQLQVTLRHFTKYSTVDERINVFSYGESRFWGQQAFAHLEPGIERIIDGYVAKAKAA